MPRRSSPASASPCASAHGVAVRLSTGEADLAEIVRALDAEGLKVENLQLHQPSLDDVFLAKTGRSLEGRRGGGGGAPSWCSRARERRFRRPGRAPRAALRRANRAAARERRLPARLPAPPAGGQLERPEVGDAPAGVSHRLVPRIRARGAVHAGRSLRDDERGHRPRARHPDGFLNRLALTPMRSVACSPASSAASWR